MVYANHIDKLQAHKVVVCVMVLLTKITVHVTVTMKLFDAQLYVLYYVLFTSHL